MSKLKAGTLPLTLLRTEPPYDHIRDAPSIAQVLRSGIALGTIWLVGLGAFPKSWGHARKRLDILRRAFPSVPVVALHESPNNDTPVDANRLATMGIRASVTCDEPLAGALREQLTVSTRLGDDILEWLGTAGIDLDLEAQTDIRRLIHASAQFNTLKAYLAERDRTLRPLAKRLERRHLPSPGNWFRLGRTLRIALRLQRSPQLSVHRHAIDLGYEDASTLRQQFHRAFSTGPGLAKRILGWEWLLARWWTLHGPTS